MRTRIIKIGNSQGIRIPKPLLEQSRLGEEVEIEAQRGRIVIHPVRRPRHGWEEKFKVMHQQGDDRLRDGDAFAVSRWDEKEWEW